MTVRWGMVTAATLKNDRPGRTWLESNGKRLRLEVLSPASASLQVWSADPPPHEYDARNPGISVVGFTVPVEPGQKLALKVALRPGSAEKE